MNYVPLSPFHHFASHFSEAIMASSDNDTQPLQPAVTRRQTVEEVKEEVKKYTYFNPKLRENAYVDGDIYDKEGEDAAKGQKDWKLVRSVHSVSC
jgi:hypothetical protein